MKFIPKGGGRNRIIRSKQSDHVNNNNKILKFKYNDERAKTNGEIHVN